MGKWSYLKDSVAEVPVADYSEQLLADMRELEGLSVADLAALYAERDDLASEAATAQKTADRRLDAVRRVLVQRMEQQGLDSVTTGGYRFTPTPEPYPSVTDRAANLAWAKEAMPDALQIQWQTLKSAVKSALETGDVLPAGVTLYLKTTLRRTKTK